MQKPLQKPYYYQPEKPYTITYEPASQLATNKAMSLFTSPTVLLWLLCLGWPRRQLMRKGEGL